MKLCHSVPDRSIEVYVAAFIRNRKGELLLCRFPWAPGKWAVPAFRVEFGERAEDALRSGLEKKFGIPVLSTTRLDFFERVFEPGFCKRHAILLNFSCKVSGVPAAKTKPSFEIIECAWKKPNGTLSFKLEKGVRRVIEKHFL